MQFVSNLSDGLARVHQFHLDTGDEGTINPFLSRYTAGLADNGAQIAFGQTHAISIVSYLVLFGTMLIDELDEAVEDGLLTRL